MRFAALIALGLVFAAGLGLAGHLIAHDTVALPVSSIEAGEGLAPARVTTATATRAATTPSRRATTTETDDDNSGSGSSNSGSGGGGGGGGGDD